MSKDPAFLFYYQDFFSGVSDMDNETVGAYIRCLCVQALKGGITEKHMKNICNSSDIHNEIIKKFILDPADNLFKNSRLSLEISKRKNYIVSRSGNRKGKKNKNNHMKIISNSYDKHMEDENINEDVFKGGVGEVSFPISRFKENILMDESWQMKSCRALKINKSEIESFLNDFFDEIDSTEEAYQTEQEVKKHFIHWCKKQKHGADKKNTGNPGSRHTVSKTFEGFTGIGADAV